MDTQALAPGIYFAVVDYIYPGGRRETLHQKVALLRP